MGRTFYDSLNVFPIMIDLPSGISQHFTKTIAFPYRTDFEAFRCYHDRRISFKFTTERIMDERLCPRLVELNQWLCRLNNYRKSHEYTHGLLCFVLLWLYHMLCIPTILLRVADKSATELPINQILLLS